MIKALLVLGLVLIAGLELRGKTSASHLAARRVTTLVVLGMGVAAIIRPDLVTRAANAVGVGRGTDLVLYVSVIAFLLVIVGLSRRLSQLEARVTELSRALAVREAMEKELAKSPPTRPDASVSSSTPGA